MKNSDQRNASRNEVSLDAYLEVAGALLSGRLLDISRSGAFFHPDASLAEGRIRECEVAVSAASPGMAAELGAWDDEALVRSAMVRWSGKSAHHDCLGIGIEFDEELWREFPRLD